MIEQDVHDYLPITQEGSKDNKFSPIAVIDQLPQAPEIWTKLERMLYFRRSYLHMSRIFPDMTDVIQATRIADGSDTNKKVANSLGISTNNLRRMRRVVERSLFMLPESANLLDNQGVCPVSLSEKERRVIEIYNAFTNLSEQIEFAVENNSELGLLLQENPHVLYLFNYLCSGKSLLDLKKHLGILRNSKSTTFQQSEQIVNLIVTGNYSEILPLLCKSILFAKFLRNNGAWFNDPDCLINKAALTVLNPPQGYEKWSDKLTTYRRFIELVPALDLAYAKKEDWDDDELMFVFASDNLEKNGYHSIDLISYFKRFQEWQFFPPAFRILAKAYIEKTIYENVIDPLIAMGVRGSKKILATYVSNGTRFLENALLFPPSFFDIRTCDLSNLCRNRRNDLNRISALIATQAKNKT